MGLTYKKILKCLVNLQKIPLMHRDSIFYRLFQQSPSLLFGLLPEPPPNATAYRFDSVAVKEPKFEIDGVFLPPESEEAGVVYFCEVQFQKDNQLYERLFGESFLYFYRNRSRYADWQAVVIYPARTTEQKDTYPYRSLLNSQQVHRIYLNELGEIRQLPLGLALMVLTTIPAAQAPEEAMYLATRSQQEVADPERHRGIMEMLATIIVYRCSNLNRSEIEAMLELKLEETRFYREVKEEGRQEGRQEGREMLRQVVINLLNEGMSIEAIARVTGLSIQQVQELLDQA
jgi:predicted transposase/invertase (TIGR01784 family)